MYSQFQYESDRRGFKIQEDILFSRQCNCKKNEINKIHCTEIYRCEDCENDTDVTLATLKMKVILLNLPVSLLKML